MILFVDDLPERFERFKKAFPEEEIVFAEDLDAACNALARFQFDIVWLDHDNMIIGPDTPIGRDIVGITWRPIAYLLAAMKFPGKVVLHSANPAGRAWMRDLLVASGVNAVDNGFPSWIFGAD